MKQSQIQTTIDQLLLSTLKYGRLRLVTAIRFIIVSRTDLLGYQDYTTIQKGTNPTGASLSGSIATFEIAIMER